VVFDLCGPFRFGIAHARSACVPVNGRLCLKDQLVTLAPLTRGTDEQSIPSGRL
jgi:hypothetical protein